MVMPALPVPAMLQPVVLLTAITVYDPGAVCRPKSSPDPDNSPVMGNPDAVPPLYNW